MQNNMFETIMGALVLIVAVAFMTFAYQSSNLKAVEGYDVKAKFSTVAGIGLGSDVRIGGIKIGVVGDMNLDPDTYKAVVTFQIKNNIKLPSDSSAAVVSDGLLGSKYIKIEPGQDEKMLASGESITITQSSVSLEEIIGKMAFGSVDKPSAKKDTKLPDAATAPSSVHN
ncbi:MAG: outer membrane lipid asymmetry maintenance protein MlaD [Pseudomonadota bacterium]